MSEINERWRKLVADGRAEWSEGMVSADRWRVVAVFGDGSVQWASDCGQLEIVDPGASCPDFDDDATLGCLLGQVRRAWGLPDLTTLADWEGKCDCDPDGHYHCKGLGSCGTHPCPDVFHADTEAMALLRALEAAPKGGE